MPHRRHKWIQRTPAIADGFADHYWTFLMSCSLTKCHLLFDEFGDHQGKERVGRYLANLGVF